MTSKAKVNEIVNLNETAGPTFPLGADFTVAPTAPEFIANNGIFINSQTVTQDVTIATGYNAQSVSPTVATGVTVTVASGSIWVIL